MNPMMMGGMPPMPGMMDPSMGAPSGGMPGGMDLQALLQMLGNPAGGAMDARFSQQPLSPQEAAMLGMATQQGQRPPQPDQVGGLMALIQQILAGMGGGAGAMGPSGGMPPGMPMGGAPAGMGY